MHPGQAGDGLFEVVFTPEESRSELIEYVKSLSNNNPGGLKFRNFAHTVKLENLKLKWDGSLGLVDDKLIENYSVETITIKNIHNQFLMYAKE